MDQAVEGALCPDECADECPVCLECLHRNEAILRCRHELHRNCAAQLVVRDGLTCPVCRMNTPTAELDLPTNVPTKPRPSNTAPLPCELCECDPSFNVCVHCRGRNICFRCSKVHGKQEETRNHWLVPLSIYNPDKHQLSAFEVESELEKLKNQIVQMEVERKKDMEIIKSLKSSADYAERQAGIQAKMAGEANTSCSKNIEENLQGKGIPSQFKPRKYHHQKKSSQRQPQKKPPQDDQTDHIPMVSSVAASTARPHKTQRKGRNEILVPVKAFAIGENGTRQSNNVRVSARVVIGRLANDRDVQAQYRWMLAGEQKSLVSYLKKLNERDQSIVKLSLTIAVDGRDEHDEESLRLMKTAFEDCSAVIVLKSAKSSPFCDFKFNFIAISALCTNTAASGAASSSPEIGIAMQSSQSVALREVLRDLVD